MIKDSRDSRDGRKVSGSNAFVTATRIDGSRDDLSFADALTVARLVLEHQGNAVPTRGKRAVSNIVAARRLARLGLVNLDEGWGAAAGTRGRSALMAAASDSATAMVAEVLQEETAEPPRASIQDETASVATANPKTDALWGSPNADGIYLTHVVVHGDDMSEEDYSRSAIGSSERSIWQLASTGTITTRFGQASSWKLMSTSGLTPWWRFWPMALGSRHGPQAHEGAAGIRTRDAPPLKSMPAGRGSLFRRNRRLLHRRPQTG